MKKHQPPPSSFEAFKSPNYNPNSASIQTMQPQESPERLNVLKIFHNLNNQRKTKLSNPKENSCAITAALDMLNNARFLEELVISYDQWPALTSIMRKEQFKFHSNTYSELADRINQMCKVLTQTETPALEDAWMILCTMRTYLDKFRYEDNYTLPISLQSCSNCKQQSQRGYVGDLEYSRSSSYENYKPVTDSKCTECGHDMVPTTDYLPTNFCIRLTGEPPQGALSKHRIPYIKDYKFTSIIQFNPQLKHFRTTKLLPNKSIVIMDSESTQLFQQVDLNLHLTDSKWVNYIVFYQKMAKVEPKYDPETKVDLQYTVPKRILCGGASCAQQFIKQ